MNAQFDELRTKGIRRHILAAMTARHRRLAVVQGFNGFGLQTLGDVLGIGFKCAAG